MMTKTGIPKILSNLGDKGELYTIKSPSLQLQTEVVYPTDSFKVLHDG